MKHEIYTTDAFVISSSGKRETASILTIFTKDFGLLFSHAEGLRKMESKLRSSMQAYSCAEVSFVRGREVWRVVNAREKYPFSNIKKVSSKCLLYVRILSLLKRFLGQEEPHKDVFNDIILAFKFLDENNFTNEELSRFELIVVLRILSHLGYLRENLEIKKESIPFEQLLNFNAWSKEAINPLRGKEKECALTINESFAVSGL